MSTMSTSERVFIKDFRPSERFQGIFAMMNAQRGMTKTGKPYLKCLFRDKTGELPARMWSVPDSLFSRIGAEGFVWAEGETQPYQGELQLIIHTIDPIEPSAKQLQELLPTTTKSIPGMFQEVVGVLGTLQHPAAKALAQTYLDDEMLMDHFRHAPAARSMHHAYLGGLLEHTLQLLKVAEALLPLYPRLSRDVVLLGLFLHDLGKTRELSWETGFNYTDRGDLVGHIVEGAIMLHDKSQQAMAAHGVRMPAGFITVLQHIILSHHGIPEYGAAKIPSTPEAIFISILDNLDAKTTMALAAARPEIEREFDLGGNFTEKHWGLGTKLYRPDPLG